MAVAIVTSLYRPVCQHRLKGFIVMRPILTAPHYFQRGALTNHKKIKEHERQRLSDRSVIDRFIFELWEAAKKGASVSV